MTIAATNGSRMSLSSAMVSTTSASAASQNQSCFSIFMSACARSYRTFVLHGGIGRQLEASLPDS